MVLLTHGYSTDVMNVLLRTKDAGKRFSVFVTESRPGTQTCRTADLLLQHEIAVTVIPDSAVAHIMQDIDLLLFGTVAVVENGGILNKIGTYQMSIVAKTFHKPVYVVAPTFKFTRLYPLNQKDFPNGLVLPTPDSVDPYISLKKKFPQLQILNPQLDYTPPSYLTLLFTDVGILTPSAVSDELIKLYT